MSVTHPDAASKAHRWFPWRAHDTPVRRFVLLAPAGLAVVVGLGSWLFADAGVLAMFVGMLAFVAGAVGAAWQLRRRHPHARLGFANAVTLLRLALVSTLIIPLVGASPAPVAIVAIATLSLSLDGVDGWLARRQGLSSEFGGSFDMEVDSVFALVLALLAVIVSGAPWFVVLLGLPRYLFWVAGALWPWLYDPLPSRYSGKVVAVVQMITLIVLQLPWLPFALSTALTVGVLAALGWSFGRDIVWLWRRRR